jgi:glyoxylase-like metal-dependent hydrolase (beta-lactamase superfamily II)
MMEMQAGWLGVQTPEVAPPDASVEDGLKIGLPNLPGEVLHTPGHTEGSSGLYFGPQQLLFAGDTLFAGSIGRTDLPGGDGRKIIRSIRERLLTLPDHVKVIPGHGSSTTIAEERIDNPFLQGIKFN